MTVSRSSGAICLLALVLAPWLTIERSRAQTQPGPYAVTDLGPVGTVTAQANDINDAGQAVGSFSATGTTGPRAFVWQDGLLTVLSNLHSGAGGISPNGRIVGTAKIPPSTFFEGVIFENGGVTPLGFQGTTGAAINDHRQVVGTINHAMPFLWDNGVLTELGTFGGPCGSAADINNLGQVVGLACTSTGTELGPSAHAFLWQGGVMTEIEPFPGHVDSGATAINSLGQIAGWSSITDPEVYDVQATSFIYENGAKRALPIPSTEHYANDINDLGHVVGSMRAGGFFSNFSGYIFKDGVGTNLNTVLLPGSGLHILYANAINNAGEIVGIAYDSRIRYARGSADAGGRRHADCQRRQRIGHRRTYRHVACHGHRQPVAGVEPTGIGVVQHRERNGVGKRLPGDLRNRHLQSRRDVQDHHRARQRRSRR